MAHRYPTQTYAVYPPHPHWPEEVKPYAEHDQSVALDEESPMHVSGIVDSRRSSTVKIEDEYHGAHPMYHERPTMVQLRHYSHPNVPLINTSHHNPRPQDHTYSASYAATPWSAHPHSGSSTPTPMFAPVQEPIQVQFTTTASAYPFQTQDPASAVSMSPQSSQGGWASAGSSDGPEQRNGQRTPQYRPMSPMTVLRSDGIRKKNARFEIPKERNLSNIDALIAHSTDDQEKKELKQQKRLLRNRQAALDSRQRKKQHTEALEVEKKTFSQEKKSLEDHLNHIELNFNQEREAWRQQQQQYDHFIQQLQFERDEAIRTKTIETGELRRQNNVLKDVVRDLERQQAKTLPSGSGNDTFTNDFGNFSNLDLGSEWDDEFSLVNSDDLKMEGDETPQRQLTPRPAPPPDNRQISTSSKETFSWNTFYMCLLFGAFIASNTTKDAGASSTSASLSAQLPTLSEDYRNEAGNVLKAVLAADGSSIQELVSDRPSSTMSSLPSTISGSELSHLSGQATSSLDSLHTTLTTPSRQQQVAAAFTLTPDQYNHITNPDGIFDDDDGHVGRRPPSQLDQMYASMQAQHEEQDRMIGLGNKARERSVLLERVPEKVLKDFREMVEMSQKGKRRDD